MEKEKKTNELENVSIENSKTEIQRKNKNKGKRQKWLCGKTLNTLPAMDTSFTTMYGSFTSKNDWIMRLTILHKV